MVKSKKPKKKTEKVDEVDKALLELLDTWKAVKKVSERNKANNKKDKAKAKKLKEKDEKKGLKVLSDKEYVAIAKSQRLESARKNKISRIRRETNATEEEAEKIYEVREKKAKRAEALRRNRLNKKKEKLGFANKEITAVYTALKIIDPDLSKKITNKARQLKREKAHTITDGNQKVTFDFSKIHPDDINQAKVYFYLKRGLNVKDAVAVSYLESDKSTQIFRDPRLPGGTPREWTKADIYSARALAVDVQKEEMQNVKKGKLKPSEIPDDLMGPGNERNFFSWLGAQNKDNKVYLPTTSTQRRKYSKGALMTSFSKALKAYFPPKSKVKDLILNKMAECGNLEDLLRNNPLITNQDITDIFTGYRIAVAATDDDAISRTIMNLAEAVGVDLDKEIDGSNVGEAIYFRDKSIFIYPDQWADLDFSGKNGSYDSYLKKKGTGWVDVVEKYQSEKGKQII